jgi:hypothetical protein
MSQQPLQIRISDLLEKYQIQPAGPEDWATQLWRHTWVEGGSVFMTIKTPDICQSAPDCPDECTVMFGFGQQLKPFATDAILVRPDYINILCRINTILQTGKNLDCNPAQPSGFPDSHFPPECTIENVPPMVHPGLKGHQDAFVVTGTPGTGEHL